MKVELMLMHPVSLSLLNLLGCACISVSTTATTTTTTAEPDSQGGLSPVVQGVLMGVGLFLCLLALILFLVCCCCRPEGSVRSVPRLRLTNETDIGGNIRGNEQAIEQVLATESSHVSAFPLGGGRSGNTETAGQEDALTLYATSGQALPSYAKPTSSSPG